MTARQGRLISWAVAAIFFLAVAPTLHRLQFTSGSENLVIATALEMHRGGPKLVPNLHGEKRLAKPPLAAWMAYLSISPQTVKRLGSTDASVREEALSALAFQARWPALLVSAIMLIFVYELTRLICDARTGVWSVMACATTLLFMRYCRYATTDIYLACFVTAANVFLGMAILRGRQFPGFALAGVLLGLAMMSKGPVCLVQSIVPAAAFMLLQRQRPKLLPLAVGTILFLIVGLGWFFYVALTTPGVWELWYREVSRDGAREPLEGGNDWYSYLSFFAYMLPWIVFFMVGIVGSASAKYRRGAAELFPLLLCFVPVLIMSLFPDRHERYLLPMAGAAAVLTAMGLRALLQPNQENQRLNSVLRSLHWGIMTVICVGTFVALAVGESAGGASLLPPHLAIGLGGASLGILVAGFLLRHRSLHALPASGFALMLAIQAPAVWGLSQTPNARAELRELAELILTHHPTAHVYNLRPDRKRPPTDLGVYLNRTIRVIPDIGQVEPTTQPVVVLMISKKTSPDPQPPAGFEPLGKVLRDGKDWYWAFVRKSSSN